MSRQWISAFISLYPSPSVVLHQAVLRPLSPLPWIFCGIFTVLLARQLHLQQHYLPSAPPSLFLWSAHFYSCPSWSLLMKILSSPTLRLNLGLISFRRSNCQNHSTRQISYTVPSYLILLLCLCHTSPLKLVSIHIIHTTADWSLPVTVLELVHLCSFECSGSCYVAPQQTYFQLLE